MEATTARVSAHTADEINERIRRESESRVSDLAENPGRIDARLEELDREWDIERTLEANAASLAFAGVALGALGSKKWLLLPALVSGFLFQHATQGWCPPVPVLRRLGVRTASEIDRERNALKALRGDFGAIGEGPACERAQAAFRAAEA